MSRYYFHLRNDLDADDDEGQELPDLTAAHAKAVEYARQMAAASVVEEGKINLAHSIEVHDESGAIALAVSFGDALTILNQPG